MRKTKIKFNNMTSYIWPSNYVIVSIKLCLDVENNECIILYYFAGRIISCFEVIEGHPPYPPDRNRPNNKRCLNRVNILEGGINEYFTPVILFVCI